jgi:FixJ family two-component response regulator
MSLRARVAIVDDEEPVRKALGRSLRLAHYDVTLFSSGEDFLASLEKQVFDCMILDVNMPGISGLDVQRRLRSVSIRIPAICITGAEDEVYLRDALDAGAAGLLRKPFSTAKLLEVIRTVLDTGD